MHKTMSGDIVVASIDDEYTVKCFFESEDGSRWLVAPSSLRVLQRKLLNARKVTQATS